MTLDTRHKIAHRVGMDLPDGAYVNLGIGLPTLVANYLQPGREIVFHSENGLLGVGPPPAAGSEDPDLINAGKMPVTLLPGASIFHHNDSFIMIRGGHIDYALLGAFQVSENGDLANWATVADGKPPAVGGAMDLAAGARSVWAMMEHCTRAGEPRLLAACTYPITAAQVVKRIYTELAVIEVDRGFVVTELANGVSFDYLQSVTGAPLRLAL